MRQYDTYELTFRGTEPEGSETAAAFTVTFRLDENTCGAWDEWNCDENAQSKPVKKG